MARVKLLVESGWVKAWTNLYNLTAHDIMIIVMLIYFLQCVLMVWDIRLEFD